VKQLSEDPWSRVAAAYEVGQAHTGRVTRLTDFGAFVELEPGIEALAHSSTFAPTGRSGGWSSQVAIGTTAAFEILSIDADRKRIGVALLPEGSARAGGIRPSASEIVPGARLTGVVERHEKFGVFIFLAPGRTGVIPLSEIGIAREADVAKAFPIGSQVPVIVLEVDPEGRRIRLSAKAVKDAEDAQEVREYSARGAAAAGFGASLADKLRGALNPREK
jgi:small subunit ribosomal protein S1